MTVALRGGGALRCALPFAPARPLPALALHALAQALPPPAWHALHTRYLAAPGVRRRTSTGFMVLFSLIEKAMRLRS